MFYTSGDCAACRPLSLITVGLGGVSRDILKNSRVGD